MKAKDIKKVTLAMAISTTVLLQAEKTSVADTNQASDYISYDIESKDKKQNVSKAKDHEEAQEKYNKAKEEYDRVGKDLKDIQNSYDKASQKKENLEKEKKENQDNLDKTDNKIESSVEDNIKIQEENVDKNKSKLNKEEKELKEKEDLSEKSEKNLERKSEEKYKAKENLNKQKNKNLDDESNLKKANEDFKKAEEDKNKANIDYKNKSKELENKNKELESLNNFEKENKKLEDKVKNSNSKINILEKNKKDENNTLNKLNSDKKDLEYQLNKRQKDLEELKKQTKNSVTEKDKEKAKKQWNEGSIGFFKQNGSKKALDVFKKIPSNSKYSKNAKEYREANSIYNENDSRDLKNMLASIDALRKVNEKRQNDKGYKGRDLNVLRISDYDMAVAQANANYTSLILGKYGEDYNKVHAKIHPQQENLTWGYDPEQSIRFWWDGEKVYFDQYYKENEYKNVTEVDNKVKNELGNNYTIWHYAQIIDLGFEFGQQPTTSAGYAMGQGVSSSVFNKDGLEKTYSIDEYEKRLLNYMNGLNKIIQGETIEDKDLSQKIKNAEKSIKDFESKLQENQKQIDKVKENIEKINKKIGSKVQDNENNKKILEQNKKKLDNLNKEKENIKNQIKQKTKDKENSLENLNKSKKEYNKAKENLDKANEVFKPYKKALDKFNKAQIDLEEAQKDLRKNKENKRRLEEQIKVTRESLEKSNSLYEKAKLADLNNPESYQDFDYIKNLLADKKKYEKELTRIEEELKEADYNTKSLKAQLDQLEETYDIALQSYLDAKAQLNKFKDVEKNQAYKTLKAPHKQGYNFLYWRYGDKIYYPGEKIKLEKNLKLEAVWEKSSPSRLAKKVNKTSINKTSNENPDTSVEPSLAPMLLGLMSTFATVLIKKKED